MTTITFRIVTIAFAIFVVAEAHAGDDLLKRSRLAELRATRDKLSWQISTSKGARQQLLMLDQRRVSQLIDDVEQGRAINPAELDRLCHHRLP